MDLCERRLLNIKVPDRISRIPKSLSEYKRWKGSEHRSWILYYCLPVLRDILPLPYFKHLSLLVASIHVLLSDDMKPENLDKCEEWLRKFYIQYEELYGI